jgi:hypothetical protein
VVGVGIVVVRKVAAGLIAHSIIVATNGSGTLRASGVRSN